MIKLPSVPLLAIAMLLVAGPPAYAGHYLVRSCKTPEGKVAPTDGWSVEQTVTRGATANACPYGGSMEASLSGGYDQPSGARVGWRFDAPPDTSIDFFTVWHTATAIKSGSDTSQSPSAYVSYPSADFTPDSRTWCSAIQDCTTLGRQTDAAAQENSWWSGQLGAGVTQVHFEAGCVGSGPCVARGGALANMAVARAQAFQIQLFDGSDPQVSNVRGTLTEAGGHRGVETVSFDARDKGSGLFRSFIEVAPVGSGAWERKVAAPVDANDGRCVELDSYPDYEYEFGYRVPCKLAVAEDLPFDTTTLANGDYDIRVRVEDAAANAATVYGPRRITISNRSGALSGEAQSGFTGSGSPGSGASATGARLALRGARRRSLPFGRSTHLAATLRDGAGRAIPGASVGVLERKGVPGARWVAARSPLITDAEGRVRWTAPPGFSRRIRLVYRADPSDPGSQAITEVALKVRSKTSLRGNRSFLHNGGTLKFTGRLLSRPVPRGGVVVELQARVGSGWVTFKTRRTARDGRWRAHYRFHATSGLQTYRFRARVRRDTGFAYEPSASRTIRVKVRG